jgi:hypothetical protein
VVLRYRRRPVSETVRFGPISPGGRQRLAARLIPSTPSRRFCPGALMVTERAAPESSTVSWSPITCLRVRSG